MRTQLELHEKKTVKPLNVTISHIKKNKVK